MKILNRVLLIALATVAFNQFSPAQMGMGMRPPDIPGVFKPVVGAGASYEIASKNDTKRTIDVTVVDKEGGGYWVEFSTVIPEMSGTWYMKELLARQGDDLIVQHMIVQMPGHPPMDMSSMPHSIQSQKEKADYRANAQNLGTESVTTPAGTFSCQHWRDTKDGDDYWLSEKVLPWQLVKMTGTDGKSVTLVRTISDAKTHITETPVSMQDMMKQRMGQ